MMKLSRFLLQFWILTGLIVTVTINIILLVLLGTKWHGSDHFATTVSANSTTIVVAVQVISHALGITMVLSLCALFKIHFRSSTVVTKAVSFEHVRFLNALSYPKVLLSENRFLTIASMLFVLASLVPGALWSGAISPSIVSRRVPASFQIPSYPQNLSAVFDGDDIQNVNGDFTFQPIRYTSLLVTSAQQSSSRNISQPDQTPHGKLDNSNYVYLTRSFGVGSTVGLSNISMDAKPVSYTYEEIGILANVSCLRNDTSDFTIQYNTSSYNSDGWSGTTGYTDGSYPSGKNVKAVWLFGSLLEDLFAIEADYNSTLRQGVVMMASAGGTWPQVQFDHVQCGVTFKAHNVQIDVDTVRKVILTRALNETAWPAYGDNVTETSLLALRDMTKTDNGYAGSRIGRALWVNAAKLRYLNTGNYSTDDIPEDIILQSVSDFVVSVFENTLVGIGSCRTECANSTTTIPTVVEIQSVIYGAAKFIYIITALNFLLVIAALYMVVLRRPWTKMVDLDFADIADVALNASRGGTDLFNRFADHNSWLDAKFTLQSVQGRWPGIVAANNLPGANKYAALPYTPWRLNRQHSASISMDRLLSPEQ